MFLIFFLHSNFKYNELNLILIIILTQFIYLFIFLFQLDGRNRLAALKQKCKRHEINITTPPTGPLYLSSLSIPSLPVSTAPISTGSMMNREDVSRSIQVSIIFCVFEYMQLIFTL